jgi:enoyl-CoA hydratase/carnithine racemase
VPEAASSLLAPRLMGHRRAFSLLVMGKAMSAHDARMAGLVNAVVPASEVESEAMAAAREIAALPPDAVAAARRLMRGSPDEAIKRIDDEAILFNARLKSPEARAAFESFLARKR